LNKRFYSLDIFRGATVAFMILVNNPGSSHVFEPLDHAPWHGCTPTDLVFPFFLFAVGNALAFVMPRLEAGGTSVFLRKVIIRTLLIFGIGLFLNWSPFVKWSGGHLVFKYWVDPSDPSTGIRILGVLQRIALAYFFASLIIWFFKLRGAFVVSVIILLVYWFLSFTLGSAPDPYSLTGYFGTSVDKAVLHIPHMYKGEDVAFDPEGIASTMTAIVQVIFGYMVGFYILQKGKTYEMVSGLFVAACVLIFTGFAWDMVFPINKKIWTSSYVLYTTGLAMLTLSVLIYYIELKERKPRWTRFFDVFGKNALFIFFIAGFLPRLLGLLRWTDHVDENGKKVYTTAFSWFYQHICKPIPGRPEIGSLVYSIGIILLYWLMVYWLDRKKIYIKV
jgi:predicted acyltransferase